MHVRQTFQQKLAVVRYTPLFKGVGFRRLRAGRLQAGRAAPAALVPTMSDENHVTNAVEELPLSQLKSSSVFDVPETAAPPESDESSLPLGQRLSSTKAPTRRDALKELAQLFASGDVTCFGEYAARLRPALEDKGSLCHEGALDATLAFAQHAPEAAVKEGSGVAKVMVEKHLAGKFQAKVVSALLCLLEVGAAEAVQAALQLAVEHKIPKLKAGGARAAVEAMRVFGGGSVDAKALTGRLPELLDHRDKDVREQGAALLVELRRARGDGAVFAQLKALKLTEDRIATMREVPLPAPVAVSYTRQRAGASSEEEEVGADQPPPPQEACAPEPFDLLGHLPRTKGSPIADKWEKSLSAEKWGERKAAAELILSLTEGQPLLCAGDYSEVAKGLAKLARDINIAVVATAIKAIKALAAPLGRDFAGCARKLAPVLLDKGADKNKARAPHRALARAVSPPSPTTHLKPDPPPSARQPARAPASPLPPPPHTLGCGVTRGRPWRLQCGRRSRASPRRSASA